MPETTRYRSALGAFCVPGRFGAVAGGATAVAISERIGRTLVQVSGWPESFGAACEALEGVLGCEIPADCRMASTRGALSVFRVAPERLWLSGSADDRALADLSSRLGREALVTCIDQSRVVLRIAGRDAALVVNRGLPVDLDSSVFAPGAFAQSAIHGMAVLVHRVGAIDGSDGFDVYVPRDYAVSFWEWLTGVAQTQGYEVGRAR